MPAVRLPIGRAEGRVGLAVVFAALGREERAAIRVAWDAAARSATAWRPAFASFGVKPLVRPVDAFDVLVYLGESSRFETVAGRLAASRPVLFVKSTIEQLLDRAPGTPPRYRVCTGVDGIARALAGASPAVPTIDWTTLPWPQELGDLTLAPPEQRYVDASIGAFRRAARARGIRWLQGLPRGTGAFSVFLTMHDPLAARLAAMALRCWRQCIVLAADGMVSTRAPDGSLWPRRVIRVRHWTPRRRSRSNAAFAAALDGAPLPDFDSAGMLFGALSVLDRAFARGIEPSQLERSSPLPGPLGPVRFTRRGHPSPARVLLMRGEAVRVVRLP